MTSNAINHFIQDNKSENIALILKDCTVITGKRLQQGSIDHKGILNLWSLERWDAVDYIVDGNEIASINIF